MDAAGAMNGNGGRLYENTDGGVVILGNGIELDPACPDIRGPDLWGGRLIFFPTAFSGCCRTDGYCGGTSFALFEGEVRSQSIPGATGECESYDDLRALAKSYDDAPPPSYPAPQPHFTPPSGPAPPCHYPLRAAAHDL